MRMQKVCSCNSDSPWLSTSHTEFVGTLAPQERPFLRSNQITTSYVNRCNVRYNKMSASMHNLNAYVHLQPLRTKGLALPNNSASSQK